MGNELLQIGNAGSNAVIPYSITNFGGQDYNNANGSLFTQAFNGKNYSNDMMMPDYLKTGNVSDELRASIFGPIYTQTDVQNQVQVPSEHANVSSQLQRNQLPFDNANGQYMSSNIENQSQMTQDQIEKYYNDLLDKNPNMRITPKGNIYEVSNAGKKTGFLTGIAAGLGSAAMKLFKGESALKVFNIKTLALKIPVLAVTGWALGSVIDSFTNTSSANKADSLV